MKNGKYIINNKFARSLQEILEQTDQFELVSALPKWRHRGIEVFEGGMLD
jgi:predicted nuclease of restriction endonuclease-like RecB superfamily